MRAIVQRVSSAEVRGGGKTLGSIRRGLLVLLGVGKTDEREDAEYLANKTLNLRIFEDEQGRMNLSVQDVRGGVLVVSQFTLYGDCRKGNRPSFSEAARPEKALKLYKAFLEAIQKAGIEIASGDFQTMMDVSLVNQGPVTVLLESRKVF